MEKTEIGNRLYKFIDDLPEYTAGGMSINDIKYDGIPIWWFFKAKFREGKLPFQSPGHEKIVEDIAINRKITFYEKVKNLLKMYIVPKIIRYNEELKIVISGFNRKQSQITSGKKAIMILAHTNAIMFNNSKVGFEVDRIESVIRKIREDDELQEYVSIVEPLSHNSLLNLLRYENIIYRYMDLNLQRKAIKEASKLHRQWTKIRNGFYYTSEFDTKIYSNFLPALDLVFSKEMIYIVILYYEAYKKVISKHNIRLLVVYAPTGIIIGCAMAAADKKNIKTLHIEHGVGGAYGRYPYLQSYLYHAVDTENSKKKLIEDGTSPERVFITGSVPIDDICNYIGGKRTIGDKKRILFAIWPYSDFTSDKEWYKRYLEKYLQEMNSVGNVEVIIKLHPRDRDIMFYKSMVDELGYNNVKIVKTEGKTQTKDFLWSLIRDSDLVVSFGSSVSVEASIIGTPSLIIDVINIPDPDPLRVEGFIHLPRDENISKIVREILYDKKKMSNIIEKVNLAMAKYLSNVDGKAGERILKIIKELAK